MINEGFVNTRTIFFGGGTLPSFVIIIFDVVVCIMSSGWSPFTVRSLGYSILLHCISKLRNCIGEQQDLQYIRIVLFSICRDGAYQCFVVIKWIEQYSTVRRERRCEVWNCKRCMFYPFFVLHNNWKINVKTP